VVVECPEQIDVSRNVDQQVEELGLEGDAGRALTEIVRECAEDKFVERLYTRSSHLVKKNQDREQMGQVPWTLIVSGRIQCLRARSSYGTPV
jgi:hypothetical protein